MEKSVIITPKKKKILNLSITLAVKEYNFRNIFSARGIKY